MTQGEGTIINGGGSSSGQYSYRWGDYTSLAVDPSDDCTFWYTDQYLTANGTFNWHTRIGAFKVGDCGSNTPGFSLAATPAGLTVSPGSSGSSTISTSVTSGSAQTVALTASGQPAGTTVGFNPASVTAGGSSTMTVAVGSSTAPGTYTITVTGTGTSAAHTTTVALTVPGPPGVILNPGFENGNLSGWTSEGVLAPAAVRTPHTGSYAAKLGSSTAFDGDSTLTQMVTVPSGSSQLTFWYQPHCTDTIDYDQIQMQIQSSDGSVLATPLDVCSNTGAWTKVTYDTSSLAGQAVVLRLNVHDDGYAGDPTYALYDDFSLSTGAPPPPPPSNVVLNPGFEKGNLTSWSLSGKYHPIVVRVAHSGTYGAQVGATKPVNGDSTLKQTVTVPTGPSTLSFWYQPHCTDVVAHDQIQMQVRTTGGATLATVLNVCDNSGAWTQATLDTTPWAGQKVLLWFNDHDDGHVGDPTYFVLDDVSLG
jgi:hypothetical protein